MAEPSPLTGAPCWMDLSTSDPDKSAAFYGAVFGWGCVDQGADYGHYRIWQSDGHTVGGAMKPPEGSGIPDAWCVYLRVDDADKAAALAIENGGAVLMPVMDVLTLGRMAIISDPSGAVLGMWQPGEMSGLEVVGDDGAPAWFELHTREKFAETVAFYETVFGWDAHEAADSSEFRYTTLGEGESRAAGIMDDEGRMDEGHPSYWTVYVQVADTDAAAGRAREAGGTTVMDPQDTPYGRLAVIRDTTGAAISIMGPNRG